MVETLERNANWPIYMKRWEFDGTAEDAVRFAGSYAGYAARTQYEFMLKMGLLPNHRFLDLGCGCLRGTIRLVDYLKNGNFYGADISLGLLKHAMIECDRINATNVPLLQLIDSFDLARVFPEKFDFILCVELLSYLDPDDVDAFFAGVASVLAPGGKFYFTLYPSEETEGDPFRKEPYLMWWKRSWLVSRARAKGIILHDPELRFHNRLPPPQKPILKIVNSMLPEWVMEGTLA